MTNYQPSHDGGKGQKSIRSLTSSPLPQGKLESEKWVPLPHPPAPDGPIPAYWTTMVLVSPVTGIHWDHPDPKHLPLGIRKILLRTNDNKSVLLLSFLVLAVTHSCVGSKNNPPPSEGGRNSFNRSQISQIWQTKPSDPWGKCSFGQLFYGPVHPFLGMIRDTQKFSGQTNLQIHL